jgi:GNAT superfamily N-acetyltransferase
MTDIRIIQTTIADLAAEPAWRALIDEYSAEASVKGMPKPREKLESYAQLESAGILRAFGAYDDKNLVGLITVLTPNMPHYGIPMSVTESYFVARSHRKLGIGARLRSIAEDTARSLGSPGLFISAPSGGDLEKILPLSGYAESNRVFFKKLTDD